MLINKILQGRGCMLISECDFCDWHGSCGLRGWCCCRTSVWGCKVCVVVLFIDVWMKGWYTITDSQCDRIENKILIQGFEIWFCVDSTLNGLAYWSEYVLLTFRSGCVFSNVYNKNRFFKQGNSCVYLHKWHLHKSLWHWSLECSWIIWWQETVLFSPIGTLVEGIVFWQHDPVRHVGRSGLFWANC